MVRLLDEPSPGLGRKPVTGPLDVLGQQRGAGRAVLLIEQNATAALRVADVGCVMDPGQLRTRRPAAEMLTDIEIGRRYLSATAGRLDLWPSALPSVVIGKPLT